MASVFRLSRRRLVAGCAFLLLVGGTVALRIHAMGFAETVDVVVL